MGEGSEERRKGTFGFLSKMDLNVFTWVFYLGVCFRLDCAKYALPWLPPKAWSMGWLIRKADLLRVACSPEPHQTYCTRRGVFNQAPQ